MTATASSARAQDKGPKIPFRASSQSDLVELEDYDEDSPEPEIVRDKPVFKSRGITYCMPSAPSGAWAVEYLDLCTDPAKREIALVWLYKMTLGEEGYAALKAHKRLDKDQLKRINQIIFMGVLGEVEGPKKND